MEKKIYKAPVARVIEIGTDDILECNKACSGVWGATGVTTGKELGDCFDPNDVSYSKGDSWEMDW